MEWRQKLRAYDSDVYIYVLVFNRILEFSKFIKTINKRDLYEELSREKLRQPYLQLIAVHHIMTGPERYTDDQLLPILEPLNEYNLQGQWVCDAVREMFEDNTPEEAYDVIHSVYGPFPNTMDSLLLYYSIVLLKDTEMPYRHHRPDEQEMENVLSLVKVVIVGIGKNNGNIVSKLCDLFHNYTKSQSHSKHYKTAFDSFMWILLVLYHELFKLQHSLTGADAMLHDIREMIMAFKYEDWENIETASAYIETCIDLQVTTPDQCLAIIKEMFNCNPTLLGYIMVALAKYLCEKQAAVTFQSMELRVLVFFWDIFENNSEPQTSNIMLCITSLLESDMKDNDMASIMSTIQELTDQIGTMNNFHFDISGGFFYTGTARRRKQSLARRRKRSIARRRKRSIAKRRKQSIYKQNDNVIRLMIYHIVAIKKPEWLRKVYLNDKANDMNYRLLRLYLEYCVPEQEPIAQVEWIHNHYSKHLPVVDAMLKVTVCGELLSQGKTETIRKIVSVHSKSLCYRRFLQYKDKTFLKLALTVFLIKQQSSSDHPDDCTDDKCHKHDIFHWKWEASPTTLQTIKHDNLKMYDHTQLPLENLYLFLVKLQEEELFQEVKLDDIIQLIMYTLKRRTIARLVLFSNMAKLELVTTTLTESFAPFLHIDGDKHQHDIIYKCFIGVRHQNKIDHVDDEAINVYQEHFPFIAAMEKEDQMEKLVRLITIVVLLILLLKTSALGLTSSQLKKYLALKYEYEDSILYLLWCSGDVEINPGPTLKKLKKVPDSQKERSWIYDTSTVVLKTVHGHDLEVKTDGLWKEPPMNWNTRQPFYDPRNKPKGSNYKLEDDISLLKNLLEFLKQIGKQLPQPFNEEVMLWKNGNKQELFQHYLLRNFEKKDITKATAALRPYSCDERLKEQLEIRNIGIVLGQAGTNKPIKNYPDVVRDIATTLCRVSKRLPITEKSDGIWKSPPLGWNAQDKYYSPCNAGKRNETDQDKQLVDNLINCCECQKIEIPSELQPMVKAWRSGNRDEVYKEYSIWANVCIIEHSLKYLEVEGLLDKPQVQQLLQELGISVSTDTAKVNPSTLNDKPATKKRKRNATVTVHEGPKKKSALSNTVIALPACDKGHETSCDPTTTQTPNKNKDDETDNGLPADTILVSHSANDKTQTNPNNLSDDDKNTNFSYQSRTCMNDGSRLPSEVNSGRNLDGSAVPHHNTGSGDGAQIVMDTVETSKNVTMDTSEQDAMDTEDPDRLQKELDDLNDNPPPDLDFVEKYLTLLRNCDSCNNEFDLLTEIPSKKSC